MAANPRAGQPALPEDLIDVAQVVTAYYSVVPDPDFTGFRVLQVTNNTIARSYYVLTAEMAGAFPLAWEKAAGGSGGLAGGKADALHGAHVATSRPQR